MQGDEWEQFKADIAANGIQTPLFITVDHGEDPVLSEGNHRRDAAVELGLDRVPVEIRFFGHAEQTHRGWGADPAPVMESMPEPFRRTHSGRVEGEPFRVAQYRPGVGTESSSPYFRDQEDLVGFVDAYREPNGNVNIGFLATRPGFEGQGIATRVMEEATRDAPEVDMGEIMHNAAGAITQRMLDEGRTVRWRGALKWPPDDLVSGVAARPVPLEGLQKAQADGEGKSRTGNTTCTATWGTGENLPPLWTPGCGDPTAGSPLTRSRAAPSSRHRLRWCGTGRTTCGMNPTPPLSLKRISLGWPPGLARSRMRKRQQ